MTMPEEINRRCTDTVSNLLFTPSPDGDENLLREGVPPERIHRVGNIMIDSLREIIASVNPVMEAAVLANRGVHPGGYALITLHRPSNVDLADKLPHIMAALGRIGVKIPVLFPMHPRTRKNCETFGLRTESSGGLIIGEPCSYREFLVLEKNAGLVLTDSGGIQEETTCFHVPCLTLRDNTERPITIAEGTNELVTLDTMEERVDAVLAGKWKKGTVPELWDGRTAERIVTVLDCLGGFIA
jgi:UDP-N-acetylglucosamine 2-epimerase (non-hydrolysing)